MIENDHQLEVTDNWLKAFSQALNRAESDDTIDPLLKELECNSLKSTVEDLKEQKKEYHRKLTLEERVARLEAKIEDMSINHVIFK
jgi:hypothetical protein